MSQLGLGMDARRRPDRPVAPAPSRRRAARSSSRCSRSWWSAWPSSSALRSLGGGTADFTGRGRRGQLGRRGRGEGRLACAQIGRTLAAAGVVATDDAFVDAADRRPAAQGIAPGAYSLR